MHAPRRYRSLLLSLSLSLSLTLTLTLSSSARAWGSRCGRPASCCPADEPPAFTDMFTDWLATISCVAFVVVALIGAALPAAAAAVLFATDVFEAAAAVAADDVLFSVKRLSGEIIF